jgi:hypothetical protein
MSGLAFVEGLTDGQGLWRDRLSLWSGAPGLINGQGGPVQFALLLEDGSFLLQEDGSYIELDP